MKKHLLVWTLATLLLAPATGLSQVPAEGDTTRLQWFRDAKLGIFIHWGIYAVDGIDESWSFHNGKVTYEEYLDQLAGFTADHYDPFAWASLIRRSGARYAVLTAKHHDGVALWPTRADHLNVVRDTPAGKDLIQPFCQALRRIGLKVGLYFSLSDWSHPDYPNFLRDRKRYENDPERWARFRQFCHGQIQELSTRYGPDLFWFDGDWEFSAEQWDASGIRRMLLEDNPAVIINSRLQGYGDYATPEQGVPIVRPAQPCWELCLTMNDNWGFQPDDTNYKTANQIIRILVECLDMGGNLLLDIGPRADGTICPEQVALLEQLGRWTGKHAEAIYGTRAGLPAGHFRGPTALSADRQTLYLYLDGQPHGPVMLKGIRNEVRGITVVGTQQNLDWDIKMKLSWSEKPGILYIPVPEEVQDPDVTVLAVHLDGPLALYRESP